MKKAIMLLFLVCIVFTGTTLTASEKAVVMTRACNSEWPSVIPTSGQDGYTLMHWDQTPEGDFYTFKRVCEKTYCNLQGCITIEDIEVRVYAVYN